MENSEIIDLAMMCMAVDQSPGDETVAKRFTAALEPWQNGFAERLIGSIRRECVDHVIVLGEAHLRRVLQAYARYYNDLRTHRSLDKVRHSRARCSGSEASRHSPSSADCITTTCESEFSVHTPPVQTAPPWHLEHR